MSITSSAISILMKKEEQEIFKPGIWKFSIGFLGNLL